MSLVAQGFSELLSSYLVCLGCNWHDIMLKSNVQINGICACPDCGEDLILCDKPIIVDAIYGTSK